MIGEFDGLAFGFAPPLTFSRALGSTRREQLKLFEAAEKFGGDERAHGIKRKGVETGSCEDGSRAGICRRRTLVCTFFAGLVTLLTRSPKANNVNSRG